MVLVLVLRISGLCPNRDAQNQVPFLAAATKDAKNEFRRFMAQNPTKYDYVKAQVGVTALRIFFLVVSLLQTEEEASRCLNQQQLRRSC